MKERKNITTTEPIERKKRPVAPENKVRDCHCMALRILVFLTVLTLFCIIFLEFNK